MGRYAARDESPGLPPPVARTHELIAESRALVASVAGAHHRLASAHAELVRTAARFCDLREALLATGRPRQSAEQASLAADPYEELPDDVLKQFVTREYAHWLMDVARSHGVEAVSEFASQQTRGGRLTFCGLTRRAIVAHLRDRRQEELSLAIR